MTEAVPKEHRQAIAVVQNGRTASMWFQWDDGGREGYYFTGKPLGDCVARAIAIATGLSYRRVHRELLKLQRAHVRGRFEKRCGRPPTYDEYSSGAFVRREQPQHGVERCVSRRYLSELGWVWVPCIAVGSSARSRLGVDPLPAGPVIVATHRHLSAVVDGVLRDTNSGAIGRTIHGYYQPPHTDGEFDG